MMHRLLLCWASLCAVLVWGSSGVSAQSGAGTAVPEPLAPWVPWVLYGHEDAQCPALEGSRVCEWPAALELELEATSGRFRLAVYREYEGAVTLPGSDGRFPQEVTLDGKPAVVLEGPTVWVPAGSHVLAGSFLWPGLPESLETPPRVGRLQLTVDRKAVSYPRREPSGLLWLQSSGQKAEDAQRLELLVSRRIEDGVPLRIITRLDFSVGGKARELVLQAPLLAGSQPVEIESQLPTRLEPDGTLRVQVAAGQHRVEILALVPAPPQQLVMPKLPAPWPSQEIWVFSPDSSLRQVELSGAPQIDPERTSLAQDWRGLATYVLGAGTSLAFETRRRGDAEPAPSELQVSRDMWLDLDGQAFTVRDQISGTLHSGFRLNLSQGELGRVEMAGQNQLITRLGEATGIEVRQPSFAGTAEWRLPIDGGEVPAVAWSEDAVSLSTVLHLPPGFALLDVDGADEVSGSLLSRWDLWDFFFVLLVALAVAKLAGVLYFPVALLALALSHHLADAPSAVLLWLIVALALMRVPLGGWARTVSRVVLWASLASTLVALVPFAVGEIRAALYPQLSHAQGDFFGQRSSWVLGASAPAPEAESPQWLAEEAFEQGGLGRHKDEDASMKASVNRAGGAVAASADMLSSQAFFENRYGLDDGSATTAVQTGPGVPNWSRDGYRLSFSGPVQRDETLTLRILPPTVNRALSVLRVLLFGLLLFGLLRRAFPRSSSGAPVTTASVATVLGLITLVGGGALMPTRTHAQGTSAERAQTNPPQSVLDELQRRLLKAPECAPLCVTVPRLQLAVNGAEMTIEAEVHAGAVSAYKVPGPLSVWAPETVLVDGKPALASARLDGDMLYLRLAPGAHRVVLRGPLQEPSGLSLHLGSRPHRVEVSADDFEVDGVRADGTVADTIALRRKVVQNEGSAAMAALPPFIEVTRLLQLGVNFRVQTTLRRVGATSSSLVARFPLLEGESVNDGHVEVRDGVALVQFGPDDHEVAFTSTLAPRELIALVAPQTTRERPFTVTWQVACGSLYHCEGSGLDPVSREADGHVVVTYLPYPGEQLKLALTRLPAADGASSTIDVASMNLRPGARLTLATLSLSVRTSGGTTVRLTLPDEARVSGATLDGTPAATRNQQGAVELSVGPGSHSLMLEFQVPSGMSAIYEAPEVRVDGELVNVEVTLEIPSSRWLLWARGPAWGPAVLFWGYLAVALLCALALSRIPNSPLTRLQWLLLSLGLTQVPAAAALTVVAWFFVMEYRSRWVPPGNLRFDIIQIVLVFFTLSAAGILGDAVHEGLVVQPDMQVAGADSSNNYLRWYVDRTEGALPRVSVISLPLWIYKGLMLAWALWLAKSAIAFLRFGWEAFSHGGRFRPLRRSRRDEGALASAVQAPAAQKEGDAPAGGGDPAG